MEGNMFNSIKASEVVRALNKAIEENGDKKIAMFVISKEEGVIIAPISGIAIRDLGFDKNNMDEFFCITNESLNHESEDI